MDGCRARPLGRTRAHRPAGARCVARHPDCCVIDRGRCVVADCNRKCCWTGRAVASLVERVSRSGGGCLVGVLSGGCAIRSSWLRAIRVRCRVGFVVGNRGVGGRRGCFCVGGTSAAITSRGCDGDVGAAGNRLVVWAIAT